MKHIKYFACGVFAFLAISIFISVAFAQSSKGFVVGTVFDPSGAVVGGATITVMNVATNVSRETITTGAGTFRLDAVDPGLYRITASAPGFKTYALNNIEVSAGKVSDRAFRLEVGGGEDVLEISSGGVSLQTQDATRSSAIQSQDMDDLPRFTLNTASDILATLPGVLTPGSAGGFVSGSEFSVNGLRPRSNVFLIDSADNNDNAITGQAFIPILADAFQEISLLAGNNAPEYGRGAGAVINTITKTGSNQFHGTIYNLIDTSSLSSLTSGQKINQGLTGAPVSIQNQPGFSLSGPLIKNKLFFFGSYQNLTFRTNINPTAIVPTADGFAMLRNLFPQGASANLDRYLGIVGNLRGTTLIRPISLGVDAAGNPISANFGLGTSAQAQTIDQNQSVVNITWTPTKSDSVGFRYLFDNINFNNAVPSAFQGFGIDVPTRAQNFLINYTRILTPNFLNEFRFSYARFTSSNVPQDPTTLTSPIFSFNGVGGDAQIDPIGLDPGFPQGRISNKYQYQDTITYTRGNHTVRAGFDLIRELFRGSVPFNNRGTFSFTDAPDALDNVAFPAFRNFIDGFSGTQGVFGSISIGSPIIFPDAFTQAYFVQDSWRLRPNLTLTYGLRYENFGTPNNVVQFPAFAGFNAPANTVLRQRRDDNNLAPRVGFAYTPKVLKRFFGGDKTVIRSGYAISYDGFFNNIVANTGATSPNVFTSATSGASTAPPANGGINRGISGNILPTAPAGSVDPFGFTQSIDRNLVSPIIQTYSLGIQRELPGNFLVDIAYVGSRSARLFINEELNPGFPSPATALFPNRGQVQLRTNGGDSTYHSLQTRVERGFRNGFSTRVVYTYSKSIDTVSSDIFLTSGAGSSVASNPFNRRVDRGVSDFDATHAARFIFTYNIPGPKNGLLGQVLGGWTLSGIYNLQSGPVATPFIGGTDLNGDGILGNDRPTFGNRRASATSVAFADPNSPTGFSSSPFATTPIDPANARFIVDPNNRANIAGRNTIRGNIVNFGDASISKKLNLPFEGHQLQLRLDAFNIFNTPNFGVGFTDVTDPNFNNPFVNDGGVNLGANRNVRIQIRYIF